MNLLDELSELGADIGDGLTRFANNAALYEKILKKFPSAAAELPVEIHFEHGDTEAALANAHTLKGLTGNLSLTPLYKAYTDIVSLMREGKPEQARAILSEIVPVQEKMIACIEKHI